MKRTALSLVLLLAACLPAAGANTPGEIQVGQVLGEALLQGLNGPARKLSSYRGKPLLINVWASWCGPCREEMASLERLAWLGLTPSFSLIGISTDDEAEAAQAFMRMTNATISQYIDSHLQMEHMLGARNLPLTVLVDANGRVLSKTYGSREWDSPEAQQMIRKAFTVAPGRH
jgi:thiol-disulfide isomerase/thioredoxin